MSDRPANIVVVFADQMRAQATGYAGNPTARTPNMDRLAERSVNFTHAVAGCPVCSPYRASLITGQRPLTHGIFLNDLCLSDRATSIAEACRAAGYRTGYVGKWHLDGHGRSAYIPPERRHGFEFWRVLECTHDYNNSAYYADDSDEKLYWDGYDAAAQTREACRYLREETGDDPFLLMLSWGPPHNPYQTAPEEFRRMYDPEDVVLRPNVPESCAADARADLAGYYAHVSALDACLGELLRTLDETGLARDTVLLFTSDHGDMLGSHGMARKQKPWDESIRVPMLLRYPAGLGEGGRTSEKIVDAPDIMPTLLSLAGVEVPGTVEGADLSDYARGAEPPDDDAAVVECISPFGEFTRPQGREYRGVRTRTHTYVRTLDGPWLLYDNVADPYQMNNLVGADGAAALRGRLDDLLQRMLDARGDRFLPGEEYIRRWGYEVDERGTVPFTM